MNAIIRAALSRARTVVALLAMILIGGVIAFIQIPKEAAPDVNIPIIYVSLFHTGISPVDAERLLVRPMELELKAVEGVREMRATAFEGGANIVLEFDAGFNADLALNDVRRAVDTAKADLPDETEEPRVNEVNISLFPVVVVTLSGEIPERTLLRIARELERTLEGLPQILSVDIAGDRDERVEIVIDPGRVEGYGLSAGELAQFISRSNRLIAAGALNSPRGRFPVQVPGLIEDVRDLMALPVAVTGDAVVRVSDVAEIRRTFEDRVTAARVDGRPALALEVSKRIGANIIDTVEGVRATVLAEQERWPPGIQVRFLQDQSQDIRTMLSDLGNNVTSAVILVMVLVVAALGVRSGLLVGIAIPGSFLAGILVIAALGLTLNMVVLFSLILAVGMLVDGAIVVTEYADRKMIEGLARRDAYRLAASRMAWPVIASTATTLAAFTPLLFWTGVVGEFMKFLPITLIATLTASLFMALIFVPTLGAWFGSPGAADARTMRALSESEAGELQDLPGFTGWYVRRLRHALTHPGKVLALSVLVLVAVQGAYALAGHGVLFFPDVEPERAIVQVHARGNLSFVETDRLMAEIEERITGISGIEALYTRIGRGPASGQDVPEDVIGSVQVELTDWETRPPASEILVEIRRRTADLAGIEVEVREPDAGPPVGKPVQVELSARDTSLLAPAVAHVRRGLAELGGFVDIEDTRPVPGIQWALSVDRAQAAKFGIDVSSVGDVVRLVTNGLKFTDYRPEDAEDEVDIVARYPPEYRSLDQLERLRVSTPAGPVPIATFVTRNAEPQVGEIRRVDGRRVMSVRADVPPGVLADTKVRELRSWLAVNPPPQGVTTRFRGEDEEQRESRAFLSIAFLAALGLMAVILLTQFNSVYSTLLILFAVVMSTIGVMIGLLITAQPFGIIMTGIGVIALAGIVVNNNIVLIDTFDRLKKTSPSVLDAILRTGAQRLRPVLLTTVTTILGLLPMMLGMNIDILGRDVSIGAPSTQWWQPLATAVVFGLAFSTVLTLIVTPSALMLRERLFTRKSLSDRPIERG